MAQNDYVHSGDSRSQFQHDTSDSEKWFGLIDVNGAVTEPTYRKNRRTFSCKRIGQVYGVKLIQGLVDRFSTRGFSAWGFKSSFQKKGAQDEPQRSRSTRTSCEGLMPADPSAGSRTTFGNQMHLKNYLK